MDERKASIEEVKLLSSKLTKMSKELSHSKHYGERTRERIRALEKLFGQLLDDPSLAT